MNAASVRDTVDGIVNSRGRTLSHIGLGLALTAGAVIASTLVARATPDPPKVDPEQPAAKPRPTAFSIIWPPLFLALTLSGLRIWNAPPSRARTQALTLWGLVQALNALLMSLGSKRLGGQLAAALTSLGVSSAYAWRAGRVDAPSAGMVAPYLGWISFANVLSEGFRRKNDGKPTIH